MSCQIQTDHPDLDLENYQKGLYLDDQRRPERESATWNLPSPAPNPFVKQERVQERVPLDPLSATQVVPKRSEFEIHVPVPLTGQSNTTMQKRHFVCPSDPYLPCQNSSVANCTASVQLRASLSHSASRLLLKIRIVLSGRCPLRATSSSRTLKVSLKCKRTCKFCLF